MLKMRVCVCTCECKMQGLGGIRRDDNSNGERRPRVKVTGSDCQSESVTGGWCLQDSCATDCATPAMTDISLVEGALAAEPEVRIEPPHPVVSALDVQLGWRHCSRSLCDRTDQVLVGVGSDWDARGTQRLVTTAR